MKPRDISFHIYIGNMMYAFRNNDINKYLSSLEKLKDYLPPDLYDCYYNFSKNSLFTRKGYLKK